MQYKGTQEWKEEIVYVNPTLTLHDPSTKKLVMPKFLDGPMVDPANVRDLRVPFANWLTAPDNPYFAKNICNRVWYWIMGRGIVNEPDDIRPTNPPTNPELLACLEGELVSHKYDLRQLYRTILTSRTYQLSWRTDASNRSDVFNFSHRLPRRLTAEQLLDAIGQVTGTSEPFRSTTPEPYTVMPEGFRAGQLFDGSVSVTFLELFGRPTRDTPYESDRDDQPSMRQAMHMLSSLHVEDRIGRSKVLADLAKKTDEQVVCELYLSAVSRPPADEEKARALAYLQANKKSRPQAIQDLLWAIFNTKEFLFNH